MANFRVKLTSQWQAECLAYRQKGGSLPLWPKSQSHDSNSRGYLPLVKGWFQRPMGEFVKIPNKGVVEVLAVQVRHDSFLPILLEVVILHIGFLSVFNPGNRKGPF